MSKCLFKSHTSDCAIDQRTKSMENLAIGNLSEELTKDTKGGATATVASAGDGDGDMEQMDTAEQASSPPKVEQPPIDTAAQDNTLAQPAAAGNISTKETVDSAYPSDTTGPSTASKHFQLLPNDKLTFSASYDLAVNIFWKKCIFIQ